MLSDELRQQLHDCEQEHVLVSQSEQCHLARQLAAIDLPLLRQLYDARNCCNRVPPVESIQPVPIVQLSAQSREAWQRGTDALLQGQVAVLVVAGGQGTRLGFHHPKGAFPISPVVNKSLFQIHAEKVLALRRWYGCTIPLLVMTSHVTDADTRSFFDDHQNFGLPADEIWFFQQGAMPAVDLARGKLLLEAPGSICTCPNGHGGALRALAESALLPRLSRRGIRLLFYFQVDNPLVKIADPAFLGHHLAINAEVSSKSLGKREPAEKLGHLAAVDGCCTILEYSELSEDLLRRRDEQGRLWLRAGNPAIHIFSVSFLERVIQAAVQLPFHAARKKVPHLDGAGRLVNPEQENALKFETFIFDLLPLAERWTVVEADRHEEFAPLKNATGADSPQAVAQAQSNLAADWLNQAGIAVPRDPSGNAAVPIEISPLFALNAEELLRNVDRDLRVETALYLG